MIEHIIHLTRGQSTVVDTVDYLYIAPLTWHAIWDESGKRFYAAHSERIYDNLTGRYVGNRLIRLHRIIMEHVLGRPLLSSEQIDHIDGNALNNRRSNLRPCSATQNRQNKRKPPFTRGKIVSSAYKGVSWDRHTSKWKVQIRANRRYFYIGLFVDELKAAAAYDDAAKRLHGDFARTNAEYRKGG